MGRGLDTSGLWLMKLCLPCAVYHALACYTARPSRLEGSSPLGQELTDFPPRAFDDGVMFKSARGGIALEAAPLMAPVAMDMALAESAAPEPSAAPRLRQRFAKLVALNRALLVGLLGGLRSFLAVRRWERRAGARGSGCPRSCRAMWCAWSRCRSRCCERN